MALRFFVLPGLATALIIGCAGDVSVCGNGLLDPGEACDAPGDVGCDGACHLTGTTAWTRIIGEPETTTKIVDVAVDRGGQIVVLGATTRWSGGEPVHEAWLRALDPAGEPRWQASVPLALVGAYFGGHMAIGDDGWIYVQSEVLHRFGPGGEPSWQVSSAERAFTGLVVADGAVYLSAVDLSNKTSEGAEAFTFAVERRDAATGERVWERLFGDADADTAPSGMALTGDSVFAVGYRVAYRPANDLYPVEGVHVRLDAATGESGPLVVLDAGELWELPGAMPSGELVIVGGSRTGGFVRRLARDGAVRWSRAFDLDEEAHLDLVTGPDASIVLAGLFDSGRQGIIRGLTGAGEPAWRVEQAPARAESDVRVSGAAFGPGFVVVAGVEVRKDTWDTGWIRKIGPGLDLGEDSTSTGGPDGPEHVLECPQPAPCGRVEAFSGCPGDMAPSAYTAAQRCALEAFAAGEPVRIAQFQGCGGPMTYGEVLLVRGDASVIVQHFESAVDGAGVDLEGVDVTLSSFAASDLCTLKPAAFFEACLGAFDVNCAYSSEWVEGCVSHAPAACEP